MPIKLLKVFLVNNFHGWFHGWGASETPGTAAQVMQQTAIIEKVPAQDLRDAEDEMPVRYLLEDIHAEPLAEFYDALLMARWAEMPALARKCQQIFMTAVSTFHSGKAVVQIAAVEIAIDHLLDIGPPETVLT